MINLEPTQFVSLMWGFAGTLVAVWLIFWIAVARQKTDIIIVINSNAFIQVITVGFALSAIVILALARVLTGELAGASITGIIGYVLGSSGRSSSKEIKPPAK